MIRTDEYGTEIGYCTSCGEEAEMYSECCEDGEVWEYDDDEPAIAGLTAPTAEVHGPGIYADADMWKEIRVACPLEAFRNGHWVKVHALGDAEVAS